MLLRWTLRLYILILCKTLCVTCAGNSDLAFVIDDTQSMWDDIDQVKKAAAGIMDIVTTEKESEIEDVVLVTFNDPSVVLREKTSKKHKFIAALGSIVVHSTRNYDCPEFALGGIEKALLESRPGSYLFVFTDASAKDYERLNEIKSLCEKKQSQVIFILTGDCRNPYSKQYLAYHEIAKASSGQVFRVDKKDVTDVLNAIKVLIKGHKSVVTSGVVPQNYHYTPFPFTVDDKTEYVVITVSGQNVDLGVSDRSTRGGKRMETEKIMWKPSGKVVKFDSPKPGTYYAWVKGESDVSIVVYARTDFSFDHGFSEFVPKSLADTSKQPIAGRKHHLSISVKDPDHTVDIQTAEIMDMNGNLLTKLPLRKANGDFYITDTFLSPSSMFKIQVTGIIKKTGNVIKRVSKTAIEVQVPPKPDSKAPAVTITEGTNVDVDYDAEISLTCKVSAYPKPNIVWTSTDGTVLSSISSAVELPYDYISYLKLSHVKNSGTYYCKASNDEAINQFSKIDVNLLSPFKIISPLPETTKVKYGDEKKLRCDVQSSQPMEIKWNTPLDPSDYSLSSDNKILTIKSATVGAQGKYTCEATLISDPKQKHIMTTNVVIDGLNPKAPEVTISEGTKIDVGYGADMSLTCKVSAYPKPNIEWIMPEGTIFSSGSSVVELPYEYISYLKMSNMKNSGTYYCKASNSEAINKFSKIDVNILSPFKIISPVPETTQAKYGEEKKLRCDVQSSQPIEIKWNTPLDPSDYSLSSDNKILTIKSATVGAQGKYTCEATLISNPTQKHTMTTNVVINDLAPPAINDTRNSEVIVSNGERINIVCAIVGGNPRPSVSWQFMTYSDSVFRDLSASGEELIVNSASLKDAGQYRCIVKNEMGQTNRITRVIVRKAPEAVILEGSQKTVEYGSTNELTCKIVAYPLLGVIWKDSKGNKLTSTSKTYNNEITSHVKIPNIIETDTYSCNAHNIMGNAVKYINLKVTSPFVVLDHPDGTTTSQYGVTKEITCNIKSKFPMKFEWFHQKSLTEITEIYTSSKYTITPNGITLRILSMDLNTVGKYTCKASLVSDGKQMTSYTTDVQINNLSPPVIENKASNQIIKQDKDIITISCKIVGGTPPPSVSWQVMRKGDNEFKDLSASGQELTLNSTLADAGKYRCIAKNVKGQAVQTTDLIIQKAPEAIIVEGATATVTYGSTKEFTCKVVAFPPAKITWRNTKGDILNSWATITNYEINSRLKIQNIRIDDTYTCYAENHLGKTKRSVRVLVSPAIIFSTQLPEKTFVKYNAPTSIFCDVKSLFPMKMKWFYQNKAKSTDISEIHTSDKYTISPDGRTLDILSTDLDLVGKYTCEASLVSDEDQKKSHTTTVEINDLKAPEILDVDKTINVMKGQDITTSCKATGLPKPVVTWQFKHKTSNVFTTMSAQAEEIRNSNINYEWAGTYICTATNVVGTQSITIDIVVLGKPEIRNNNSVYTGVTEDKVLMIPCNVTGVPEPTITWKQGGKVVTSDNKITVTKNDLIIKNPTEKDSNIFTCEATNKYGSAEKNFKAEISDFIDFDLDPNNIIYLKPGESKNIKCLLPHSDPQSVRWYVNGEKALVRGSVYSLQNAKFSNDGNYTCRVNTDQGSESKNYVVNVGYKPSFTRPLTSPTVNWNGNKRETLDCNVQAKPKETVKWFYNGKQLDSKISDLPIIGWGKYTCKVTNVHGSVEQTFNVNSTGCVINRTVNRIQNTPLLITNNSHTWPKLGTENEFITVSGKQIITLACSTEDQPINDFKTHPNTKTIYAECYKQDQFIVDGKTYKFQDLQCNEYVKPFLVNTKKPCMKNGEIIEIGYKLDNGFLGVYEVCYSKVDQRTRYTKVLMSDVNMGNIVEPSFKLNPGTKTGKHYGEIMKCRYNQRQLVNPVDVAFGPAQIATLQNINVVSVYEPCKDSSRMSWSDLEKIIQNTMYTMETFTVWTGANHYDPVGIPRYLWKVVKFDEDAFETIVYVNSPNPDSNDILCSKFTSSILSDVTEAHDKYTYPCSLDEFLINFQVLNSDFGIVFK